MELKVSVTAKLMQEVVNYLETKPYKEVGVLISDILKECNEPKDDRALVEETPKKEE